jgi:hypothetical protein
VAGGDPASAPRRDVAAEQTAASEAEQSLREGGIEGLEAWSEAAQRRSEG